MADTDNNAFSGFSIESIENDIAIKIPGSGEPGKVKDDPKKNEDGSDKKSSTINALGFDFNTKIEIPESPEEIAAIIKGEGGSTEKKEINKTDTGGEDAIIKEDSPLFLHAATLYEEGILPTLDLESLKDKPFKEGMQIYLAAQKKYIEDGRNEYQNSLSDRQKEFLEMIELGIPQEQTEHQFTIEDSYGKITDEILADDAEMQKNLIVQNYKLKGISDKKIDVFIKDAENGERLFEESKDALSDINAYIANQKKVSVETAKQRQLEADQKDQELQAKIKTTIEGLTEIFPGIPLSAVEKTKLNDYMTKPVEERIINGVKRPIDIITKTRIEDPIAFNLRTVYFITQGLYDKNTDLSKFTKKNVTSAANKLTNKLKEEPTGGSERGVKIEKNDAGEGKSKFIFPKFM